MKARDPIADYVAFEEAKAFRAEAPPKPRPWLRLTQRAKRWFAPNLTEDELDRIRKAFGR